MLDNGLLDNLDKIHTTELGAVRIKRNLNLTTDDVVLWCKNTIKNADKIIKNGKNYYVYAENITITINSHSSTIITAHRGK